MYRVTDHHTVAIPENIRVFNRHGEIKAAQASYDIPTKWNPSRGSGGPFRRFPEARRNWAADEDQLRIGLLHNPEAAFLFHGSC